MRMRHFIREYTWRQAGKGTYLSYSRTFIKMCILKDGTSLGGHSRVLFVCNVREIKNEELVLVVPSFFYYFIILNIAKKCTFFNFLTCKYIILRNKGEKIELRLLNCVWETKRNILNRGIFKACIEIMSKVFIQ
jgi:hypothetical protein